MSAFSPARFSAALTVLDRQPIVGNADHETVAIRWPLLHNLRQCTPPASEPRTGSRAT